MWIQVALTAPVSGRGYGDSQTGRATPSLPCPSRCATIKRTSWNYIWLKRSSYHANKLSKEFILYKNIRLPGNNKPYINETLTILFRWLTAVEIKASVSASTRFLFSCVCVRVSRVGRPLPSAPHALWRTAEILLNCFYSFLVNRLGEFCFSSQINCYIWPFSLFSLPNSLFCVNVRRVCILINKLGLKGLTVSKRSV